MSIIRRMDKKAVVHIHSGILAFKKNKFESVLMRWMKLEPIIQNEVSQKEKHQYSMKVKVKVKLLGHVRLFVTPWTVAYQAPPSMGFSWQE